MSSNDNNHPNIISDSETRENTLPLKNLQHLPAYANFLLENKIHEYVIAQINLAKEVDLPLLKFFKNLSDEELYSLSVKTAREFLNCCAENKTEEFIQNSVQKWINDQLPSVERNAIIEDDIILVNYIRRKNLRHFISAYTNDVELAIKILNDIDVFLSRIDLISFKTLFYLISKELNQKELQYQRMINEVEDYAILMMNKEGIIQNWNKGAEKIKGYTANEIIGKNFRIFYRQEDQADKLPEKLIKQATVTGKASHEGWRVRKDGTYFWGSIVITAIHDEDNNVIGFTKVTRNLTERKLAEDKQAENASRIANRIAKHNAELKKINKELDSFTYMASHDLQEPLRKIQTFINIISDKAGKDFPDEIRNYFNRIKTASARMQMLIESLLNYSRTTTADKEFIPVKLNKTITEVKADLAETIKEKKAIITATDLPVLKIVPLHFHQLFLNLIGNALKYSREGVSPVIQITCDYIPGDSGKGQAFYKINISDNGIGFEQQYAHNIFKLFHRLHGRTEYSGTGVGLAICKKIVEYYKGVITAVSEPGKGSTFTILLPAGTEQSGAERL